MPDVAARPYLLACYHLTLAHDPRDDPALMESLTRTMREGCRRSAIAEGGIDIADGGRVEFWPESDDELAKRQDRENRDAEDEGREPVTLRRLHFASCDVQIVWPNPTPDGSPVLVVESWLELPDREPLAIATNTAEHDHGGWVGRFVWLDGARYRVTGVDRSAGTDRGEGKGTVMALLVRPEPPEGVEVGA